MLYASLPKAATVLVFVLKAITLGSFKTAFSPEVIIMLAVPRSIPKSRNDKAMPP